MNMSLDIFIYNIVVVFVATCSVGALDTIMAILHENRESRELYAF